MAVKMHFKALPETRGIKVRDHCCRNRSLELQPPQFRSKTARPSLSPHSNTEARLLSGNPARQASKVRLRAQHGGSWRGGRRLNRLHKLHHRRRRHCLGNGDSGRNRTFPSELQSALPFLPQQDGSRSGSLLFRAAPPRGRPS